MIQIPKPEFPRPDRTRGRWLNLNGEWDFRLFPAGEEEAEKRFAPSRADYDRRITVPFSWTCPLSGVRENVAGVGWYRREAAFEPRGRLFLCFGGVDYTADVYVNGAPAGRHAGCYGGFELEVTDLWKPGRNVIEVRAEDYRRGTQFYGKQGYGDIQGIWQTVWLEDRPQNYIERFHIRPSLSGEVKVHVWAQAPDGETVSARFDGGCWQGAVKGSEADITISLEKPRLWSPEDPCLYEGSLTLGEDEVGTYFGVREIASGHVGGREYPWILLNGKPVYLQGTLDQAFNPDGFFTYPSDAEMRAEIWRLKRLGLNMVRVHIKPEEPRKLYWMDKLGILLMEDISCFWGEPVPEAREAYEREMTEIMARDINHPALFAWVMFNETWGLRNKEDDGRAIYRKETQEWVRSIYRKAKAVDPDRLVEDNSPCASDHVETDLDTWHFYLNTYEVVRDHIRHVVDNTYVGSEFNYIGGNRQTDVPLMNSECGMVWGVENSAGDSDLAWHYHYMLNEYRLHDKICGFVFTEFHDVVNEFNGYYRIDSTDKDFGYQDFCRGMSLKDLHVEDFVATDCAPVTTREPGETVAVPLVISSFTDRRHDQACRLDWELWHDGPQGRVTDASGELALEPFGYGATPLGGLSVTMPRENAVAVLSLYLRDARGAVVSRNFVTFDVQAPLPEGVIDVPPASGRAEGFDPVWTALNGDKLCLGGSGEVSFDVTLPEGAPEPGGLTIIMEAGAKRVLTRDRKAQGKDQADLDFMHGILVDRGAFDNSYWMTDESRCPAEVEALIDGEPIRAFTLPNDWADARGVLSWRYQREERHLDEAGSYGDLVCLPVPSRLVPRVVRAGRFTLTLRVRNGGGLALYGRRSGRYPVGLWVKAEKL